MIFFALEKLSLFWIWCTKRNEPNGDWEILFSLAVTFSFQAGVFHP
jgi:hypothetical protein